MAEENPVQSDLRRAFRIAWYGSAAAAAIAYAVLISLKWHELLPIKMTWLRVLLGPALLALMTPTLMTISCQPRTKMFIGLSVWFLSLLALVVVVSYFDPVPGCP